MIDITMEVSMKHVDFFFGSQYGERAGYDMLKSIKHTKWVLLPLKQRNNTTWHVQGKVVFLGSIQCMHNYI